MQSRIVPLIIIGAIVLVLSLWLGQGIATNHMQTLLIAGAGAGFLLCLLLGQRVWLLAIFLMSMQIPVIRGFGTQEIGQFLLIGFTVVIFMMHKFKAHWTFTELDFWRFALALMILQVYLRNPVGLNIFGAGNVGARPYFVAAVTFMTGFFLSKYRVDPKEIKLAYWITLGGGILGVPLGRLRLGGFRSAPQKVIGEGLQGLGAGRIGAFIKPSEILAQFIVSKVSPLKSCFHPVWASLILLCLGMAAFTGFRNIIAMVGIIFLLGIAYRGGILHVVLASILGGAALGILAFVNIAAPLPPNVQRALSVFPGSWNERYKTGAEASTEWRVEMWEAALFTDEWIHNKILGDGLGMTRAELERLNDMESKSGHQGASGLSVHQEGMMLTGGYHSVPVETVRVIGYVGLIILLIASIRLMVIAHQEILRCRGTEWFPYAMFFLVPIMMYPIFYFLIVGSFKDMIQFFFIQSGFLELFRKNLPLPAYVPKRQRNAYRPLSTLPKPNTAITERRETRARKHGAASMKTREKRA